MAAVARGGKRAWEYLRRWSAYGKAWRRRQAGRGLAESAPFPVRLQTGADLKAARWGLLAWEDPEEPGGGTPFWAVAPTLEAATSPGTTPLLPWLDEVGAALSGLRLAGGELILKIELGRTAAQLRIATGRVPGPEDGVVGEHDLLRAPSAFIARLEDACALVSGTNPREGGGWGTKTRNS